MLARLTLILSALAFVAAVAAPAAFAADAALPVPLGPGEKVVSHTTTTAKDSQYVVDLLSAIKGVKIGADKTTVLVENGGKTHPIEIDYGSALGGTAKASAAGVAGKQGDSGVGGEAASGGDAGTTGSSAGGTGGGIGLGQVAGMLLGLTVISRIIGIVRQLGGNR